MFNALLALPTGGPKGEYILVIWDGSSMNKSPNFADNEKSPEHLIHLMLTRNDEVPNFSVLLGSGASSVSGVKTADQMIRDWRRILFRRFGSGTDYQEWLDSQE